MDNRNDFKKGAYITKRFYDKTTPRKWTESEIEYMLQLKENGKSARDISQILDRSIASVKMKLKRLTKDDGSYNQKHIQEKNLINKSFVDYINPSSILDLYHGEGNPAYDNLNIITNDIDSKYDCDYNLDAFRCLCKLYSENKKYDMIDLDPFGSAYDCFDLAVKMAKKGLCVTLGEMGHKRWKRLDFVRNRYGINSLDDFTSVNLIKKIQEIGRCNKKELVVYAHRDWQLISRVWFIIEPYKETSQWNIKSEGSYDKCMQVKF